MNKTVIFVGLGLVAAGIGAYLLWPKSDATDTAAPDGAKSASNNTDAPENYGDTGGAGAASAPSGSKSSKQVRRDCRAEANAQGLKGRAKRQFRRACKRAGGVDDTADFAFNGYSESLF